jgi:hypothetical protein
MTGIRRFDNFNPQENMKMKTYKYNDYEILPLSEKQIEENLSDFALMERSDLTEKQLAYLFGTTVEQIREYVREGMPQNYDDNTFDFNACNEWLVEKHSVPFTEFGCAKDYLRDMLADGARPAREIYERGTSASFGFTARTLEWAKYALGIVSKKVGRHFVMELPTT